MDADAGPGPVAVVRPTAGTLSPLRPLDGSRVDVTGGFWGTRLRLNRERSIPHGFAELERVGNLANLRLAAGAKGEYQALGAAIGLVFPFLDSDVYKWLEAAGWELGREPDARLATSADEAIALVAAAQRPDGYINSFVQVVARGQEYRDLQWGHEMYCVGHLIQAGVAWHRALGDDRLLDVGMKAADSLDREFGPSGREGIDGHPEIEMALVELYRVTGERRYLELAARMIELRGHGLLGPGRFGSAYWQDHRPVREATSVVGHAVRQVYLDCGAVDVAVELGDVALLQAVHARWRDMMTSHAYLTGGLGAHHKDEAFGDPFELPPDRAYAETCAAIANVMLSWRLLLATGDPACGDAIERTMFNGVLSGWSLRGTDYFYVNPLQRRTTRAPAGPGGGHRQPWYACACCPPNLMRLLSSWPQYLATTDQRGIQVHQYAAADLTAEVPGGQVHLRIDTDYPWTGRVTFTVLETPPDQWTLSLRIPAWSPTATLHDGSAAAEPQTGRPGVLEANRSWQAGDSVILELGMPGRVTEADPRVDAIRGCVALERGPLVYCLETADLPTGVVLEDVQLAYPTEPMAVPQDDLGDAAVALTAAAVAADPLEVRAVPYFAWANRDVEAMRVWIPRR